MDQVQDLAGKKHRKKRKKTKIQPNHFVHLDSSSEAYSDNTDSRTTINSTQTDLLNSRRKVSESPGRGRIVTNENTPKHRSERPCFGLGSDLTQINGSTVGINLLHREWYLPKEVKKLEENGVIVKKGPFSATEDEMLKSAVSRFLDDNSLQDDAIMELLKPKSSGLYKFSSEFKKSFWQEIAMPFPQRTLRSIYYRVNRLFDPCNTNRSWTGSELESLNSLVVQFGRNWKLIGEKLGRTAENCRSRYKYSIENESHSPKIHGWVGNDEFLFFCVMIRQIGGPKRQNKRFRPRKLKTWLDSGIKHSWLTVHAKFMKKKPQNPKPADLLRLKWTCGILPALHRVLENLKSSWNEKNLDLLKLFSMMEFYFNDRPYKKRDDLTLVREISALFPRANYIADITWSSLAKKENLKMRSEFSLSRRFHKLLQHALPSQHPVLLQLDRDISPENISSTNTLPLYTVYKDIENYIQGIQEHDRQLYPPKSPSKKLTARARRTGDLSQALSEAVVVSDDDS